MSEAQVVKHESLFEALAAAQLEFEAIPKKKKGRKGNQEYMYATLDTCLEATRPQLNRHGIAVSWTLEQTELGLHCVTHLHHGKDEISCSVPMYFEAEMKGLGSAMTYAKRYGYLGVIGCTGDEDDDADMAGTPSQPPAQANPSPASQPPAEKKDPPKFAEWQKAIDACQSPQRLIQALEKARELPKVRDNWELSQQIVDAIGKKNEAAIQGNQWTAEAAADLDQHLTAAKKFLESAAQTEEMIDGKKS